ncbi:MAG: hypothetical protein P8144_03415 [Gammaproteobacteria bacterium]
MFASCVLAMLVSCAARPPADPDNICYIFEEKHRWYVASRDAEQRWGVPIPVLMSFLYQESGFRARAKPPRKWYFGFIPGPRPSSAYGYAQAIDSTWEAYRRRANRWGADRDNFADAVDFIGWYNAESSRQLGLAHDDADQLYLVYHEGAGGYRRGSYRRKTGLLGIARNMGCVGGNRLNALSDTRTQSFDLVDDG